MVAGARRLQLSAANPTDELLRRELQISMHFLFLAGAYSEGNLLLGVRGCTKRDVCKLKLACSNGMDQTLQVFP